MRRAVIVSTARTGLAKSFRGGFNNTHGAVLGGSVIKSVVEKASVEPEIVEDVLMGCGSKHQRPRFKTKPCPLHDSLCSHPRALPAQCRRERRG